MYERLMKTKHNQLNITIVINIVFYIQNFCGWISRLLGDIRKYYALFLPTFCEQ